jgi:hypothetical protein
MSTISLILSITNLSLFIEILLVSINLDKILFKLSILTINVVYKKLYKQIVNGKIEFDSRVNSILSLTSKLGHYGKVNINCDIKTNKIDIIKYNSIIFTSTLVDNELLKKIMNIIKEKYKNEIDDVVDVLGVIIDRKSFSKALEKNDMNYEEYKGIMDRFQKMCVDLYSKKNEKNPKNNKSELNIDQILDKINEIGFNNLSKEELDFLNKYSKNNI